MQFVENFQSLIDGGFSCFTAVKVLMANEPPVFKALNLLLAP
jgi:hypothetical protein